MHAPAEQVAARLPPAVAVEAIDAHTCLVSVGSDTPQLLALYLGMIDADFTIDPGEAPELASYLRTLSDRYARAVLTEDCRDCG